MPRTEAEFISKTSRIQRFRAWFDDGIHAAKIPRHLCRTSGAEPDQPSRAPASGAPAPKASRGAMPRFVRGVDVRPGRNRVLAFKQPHAAASAYAFFVSMEICRIRVQARVVSAAVTGRPDGRGLGAGRRQGQRSAPRRCCCQRGCCCRGPCSGREAGRPAHSSGWRR
jgi:hypothetical protein